MTKVKYLLLSLGFLVVVCSSSLYAYVYGFSEARKITVLDALHSPSLLLNECANNPNDQCTKKANQQLKKIRFFLARELLEDEVGLDEESKRELIVIRDSYSNSE